MIYIRGHASDYNQWAQLGNRGWSYDDVLPVFKDLEQNLTLADAFHGTAGELHVSEPRFKHPLCQAFVRAAQETGLPYNPDFNGKVQEGVVFIGPPPMTGGADPRRRLSCGRPKSVAT